MGKCACVHQLTLVRGVKTVSTTVFLPRQQKEIFVYFILVTPRNCFDIFNDFQSGSQSPGLYHIYILDDDSNQLNLTVYCRNGWTEVQKYVGISYQLCKQGKTVLKCFRRFDESLNFQRSWIEYESGFGALDASGQFNYWMGNQFFHYLTTNQVKMGIRFNFKYCNGSSLMSSTYTQIQVRHSKIYENS